MIMFFILCAICMPLKYFGLLNTMREIEDDEDDEEL